MSSDASPGHGPGHLQGCSLGGLPAAAEIARAFVQMRELETLEGGALAAAVHPAGAGCGRAWLLVWNARSGLLEGGESVAAPASRTPLIGWLEHHASPRMVLEAGLPALSLQPERLGRAVARAWNPGATAPVTEPEGGVPWVGAAHVGAVALRRSGRPWALIVGTWSAVPGEDRRAALEAIGSLCVQAAQVLDLERDRQRRAGQVAALGEAVRALSSTLEVAEVLQQVARLAAQGTGARGSALWVDGPEGLRLEATHGAAWRCERTGRGLQALAKAVTAEGQPQLVEWAAGGMWLAAETAAEVEAIMACPLRAYGRVLGTLACYGHVAAHRSDPVGFPAGDLEFAAALAEVGGLAVDQAARFTESRRSGQQRCDLAARLERHERLVMLGELAGRMAQEARKPLASVGAFARRAQRSLAEDDPRRDYLEIILRETERLERLLAEPLDYAPEAGGALRLESLDAVVREALSGLGEALARRRVRLVKRLSPDLPALLLDRERILRVVTNILESALEAVSVGGRIRLDSRQVGTAVVLEVAHDGPCAPGALLEQLFVPFASARPGGVAVGLAVARQVVREHGGEIRVRGEGEWGTVFSVSLPVRENQDRRRPGPDRRRNGGDRRGPRSVPRTG